MKLDEYIEQTIKDIVNGVKAAKEDLAGQVVAISDRLNPHYEGCSSVTYVSSKVPHTFPMMVVDFKVSLQVEKKIDVEGKAELDCISLVNASANGKGELANSSLHEVKFSVPLVLQDTQSHKSSGPAQN